MAEREEMSVSFVYMVALCLIVLPSSSSLTAGVSPPSCRDREAGEWWVGLKENALQPDPAPFRIETELAETSTSTNCAKQFNVHIWSKNNKQFIAEFFIQGLSLTNNEPSGKFSLGQTSSKTVDCIHKQDSAMHSTQYSLSNHVQMNWESSCINEDHLIWWVAVLDDQNHLYVIRQIYKAFAGGDSEKTGHELKKRVVDGPCGEALPSTGGSCAAAGYLSCCSDGICSGQPSDCFCDANCQSFDDCCSDVPANCSTGSVDPYLLVADFRRIHAVSFNGSRIGNIITDHRSYTNIFVVDYHSQYGLIFWSDIANEEIWMAPLNGTSSATIISQNTFSFGITVDWIGNYLYWTDYSKLQVNAVDFFGGSYTSLVDVRPFQPTAIAVDPITEILYWFEISPDSTMTSRIRRSSLDGSNTTIVVNTTNEVKGHWMAVDFEIGTIYWTDFIKQEVWSFSSDGGQITLLRVFDNTQIHPRGIDVYKTSLFISDSSSIGYQNDTGEIQRVNKTTGAIEEAIFSGFCSSDLQRIPRGIKVFKQQIEIEEVNPCTINNGNCSHFCFRNTIGNVCRCPTGQILTTNQRKCIWQQEAPSIELHVNQNPSAEGSTVEMVCTSVGNPPPTVSWVKREGNEWTVLSTGRINIITTSSAVNSSERPRTVSTVTIQSATPYNSGEYICRSFNTEILDPISNSIDLNIAAKNECLSKMEDCPNGACLDLIGSAVCRCDAGYAGPNCTQPDNAPVPTNVSISNDSIPQNGRALGLTCNASSDASLLQFQWYRDEEALTEAVQPFLLLEELHYQNRGSYTCAVSAGNHTIRSDPFIVSLPGVYQFIVFVTFDDRAASEDDIVDATRRTIDVSNSFLYSIQLYYSTNESSGFARLLITVQSGGRGPADIFHSVQEILTTFSFTVLNVSRYDGCLAETTAITVNGKMEEHRWPETDIGVTQHLPCSSTGNTGRVYRKCGGSYSKGAKWRGIEDCECRLGIGNTDSSITQTLCNIGQANDSSKAEVIVEVTSNASALTATDITATVTELETLLESAAEDEQVRQNVLQAFDNVQLANPEALRMSQNTSQAAERIRGFISTLQVTVIISSNESIVFTGKSFAFQVNRANNEDVVGNVFNVDLGNIEEAMNISNPITKDDLKLLMTILDNSTASVTTTRAVFNQHPSCAKEEDRRIGYSVFRTDALFPDEENGTVTSLIVGLTISCNKTKITSGNESEVSISLVDEEESVCAAYENSGRFGRWSSDNCKEVQKRGRQKECVCKKITHFGLLLDLSPGDPLSPITLEVLTYIGLILSLISLIILIIMLLPTVYSRREATPRERNQRKWKTIVLNLSISLVLLYVTFLCAGHATSNSVACGILSGLLHYFFIVFFGWTAAQAVYLFITVVYIMNVNKLTDWYTFKAGIFVWSIPILIVVLCGGAGREYYTSPFFCRPTEYPFWFGMVLPFVVLYIFNWILFVIILVSLCKNLNPPFKQMDDQKKWNDVKRQFKIALCLAALFGFGWGIGLFATDLNSKEATFAVQIVFSIFVGSQGILFFLLQGLLSKQVREYWRKKFNCVRQNESATTTSRMPHSDASDRRGTMVKREEIENSEGSMANPYQQMEMQPIEDGTISNREDGTISNREDGTISNHGGEGHYAVPRPASPAQEDTNNKLMTSETEGVIGCKPNKSQFYMNISLDGCMERNEHTTTEMDMSVNSAYGAGETQPIPASCAAKDPKDVTIANPVPSHYDVPRKITQKHDDTSIEMENGEEPHIYEEMDVRVSPFHVESPATGHRPSPPVPRPRPGRNKKADSTKKC